MPSIVVVSALQQAGHKKLRLRSEVEKYATKRATFYRGYYTVMSLIFITILVTTTFVVNPRLTTSYLNLREIPLAYGISIIAAIVGISHSGYFIHFLRKNENILNMELINKLKKGTSKKVKVSENQLVSNEMMRLYFTNFLLFVFCVMLSLFGPIAAIDLALL